MLVTNTREWIVQTRQSKQRRGIVVVFPTPEELARNKFTQKATASTKQTAYHR